MRAWFFDALVIFGVIVTTLGVVGMATMPDIYMRLHASSKAVVLGVLVLCVAGCVVGEQAVIMRVILIGGILVLTTPVSSHVVARGAHARANAEPAPPEEAPLEFADDIPPWRL
jgi:monovalent cation/proton antiporter MnhG/PhaG subunit